ncbi:MAG: hypothetical protein RIC35_15925 [Marinoscillum sp.]
MKNLFVVKFLLAFSILIAVSSCTDDPKEVVLDGISIDGQPTTIKLEAVVVSEIASTSAKLQSGVVALDADYAIIDVGFVYSSSNSLPSESDNKAAQGSIEGVSGLDVNLTSLDPTTIYYARAYVETDKGFGFGNVVAFTTAEAAADVIVINEGNFASGDGSLSTFNTITDETKLSVFASANGFPIAATIQNALVYDDKIFAITNVADKLEVIDLETFKFEAYINTGLSNPFSFAAIGDKAYVTNWGTLNYDTYAWEGSFIAVVDLESYVITDSIMLNVQPQHVIAVDDYFYVANVGSNSISVYNSENDQEVASIEVSASPDRMVVDANNNLWVFCNSGNLVRVDTETNSVETTISGVQGAGYNEKMVINSEGNKLYYLSSSGWPDYNTAIYELSITATSAPTTPVVSGLNYYGLGISLDNELYVTDAKAFQGNGTVYRYNLDGTEINSFPAGRGPNGFIFR